MCSSGLVHGGPTRLNFDRAGLLCFQPVSCATAAATAAATVPAVAADDDDDAVAFLPRAALPTGSVVLVLLMSIIAHMGLMAY